jgi:hypothetical protein
VKSKSKFDFLHQSTVVNGFVHPNVIYLTFSFSGRNTSGIWRRRKRRRRKFRRSNFVVRSEKSAMNSKK